MTHRRTAARLGAVAFLLATAAVLHVGTAEARIIAGMDISDCVPGASICGASQPTGMNRLVRARICRAKAARSPFPEDRPMAFAVCMRSR